MRPPLTRPQASTTKLRELANKKAAIERLALACQFAVAHLNKPLFQRRVKMNGRWVIIRLEWPCMMSVFDLKTGQPLAVSRFANPGHLDPCFDAPDPDPAYQSPNPISGIAKHGG
jgi:hypothetical protein